VGARLGWESVRKLGKLLMAALIRWLRSSDVNSIKFSRLSSRNDGVESEDDHEMGIISHASQTHTGQPLNNLMHVSSNAH